MAGAGGLSLWPGPRERVVGGVAPQKSRGHPLLPLTQQWAQQLVGAKSCGNAGPPLDAGGTVSELVIENIHFPGRTPSPNTVGLQPPSRDGL